MSDEQSLYSLYALHVFGAVTRHGSLTRAAEELEISQPAVSRQIKILEDRYGERLLERTPRGVLLTACGRVVAEGAQKLFAQMEEMAQSVKVASGSVAGEVRMAASTTPGAYLLPRLLKSFRARYPEARPVLTVHDSERVANQVVDYQVHLGVLGQLPALNKELHCSPLRQADTLSLVTAGDDPLARVKAIQPGDLRGHTLLLRERGSSTREEAQGILADLSSAFGQVVELSSSEAIKEAVLAGLGVAVLSSWAIRREEGMGLLRPVADPALSRQRLFYLVRRSDRPLVGVARAIWDFLAESED